MLFTLSNSLHLLKLIRAIFPFKHIAINLTDPCKQTSWAIISYEFVKIIYELSFPKIVQSDNRSEFVNKIISMVCFQAGFNHQFISSYHLQANRAAESHIKLTKSLLLKSLKGDLKHWSTFLPIVQFALNLQISCHSDSKPFELFFDRPHSYPDNYFNNITKLKTLCEIISLTKIMLQIIYPSIYKKVANIEKHFNINNKIIQFSPGDKVMLKNSSAHSKTNSKFLGPFIIHHYINNRAYVSQDIFGNILLDKVPLYALKPVDPDTSFKDKHFEVEKVLDHEGPPSDHYYLMKWKGYPDSDNSWVATEDSSSQRPIITYWGKKYPKKRHKWR